MASDEEPAPISDVPRSSGRRPRDDLSLPQPGEYPFWMKNTLIPLTPVWMDSQHRIVTSPMTWPCKADLPELSANAGPHPSWNWQPAWRRSITANGNVPLRGWTTWWCGNELRVAGSRGMDATTQLAQRNTSRPRNPGPRDRVANEFNTPGVNRNNAGRHWIIQSGPTFGSSCSEAAVKICARRTFCSS